MYVKRKYIAEAASAVLMCAAVLSCSVDEAGVPDSEVAGSVGQEVPTSAYEQGLVRVKVTEELAAELESQVGSGNGTGGCEVKSVRNAVSSLGIVRMERTFPYAGKFEPRTREAGLHLWYDVYFDKSNALTKASAELSSVPGVETVEYRPKTVRISSDLVPGSVRTSADAVPVRNSAADVFDDPFLPTEQWHYFNDGNYPRSIAGADINVLPVWEKGIVGSEDVIVAVVDGGIDFTHEDLADNMWSNPDISDPEFSHGYNFVRNNYRVTPDEHGTHVAGTVAAVNDNGIGVCGVAGGDKAAGIPGVRLMSCQIFEGDAGARSPAEAIKWGADHGAVISQNSWGYDPDSYLTDTPPSDRAAIDYFVKNAGFDENGVQTGPMAGGIVIFAAGNDERNIGYPGSYENCLSVSAIAADYEDAYYTNYGNWVDVAAPGGDRFKSQMIYSTLPGNRYGGMEGTSMACPHVSGMAALLVSRYGGLGFTSGMLREMIEGSVRDISMYTDPSKYIGKGLVDVDKAMSMASTQAPDPVLQFSAEARSNFIDFTLTVPSDPDDIVPAYATLHYSTSPFDPEDSQAVDQLPFQEFSLEGYEPGDQASFSASGLEFDTRYYVSASVRDLAHNRSALYPEVTSVVTGSNSAPVISPDGEMDLSVRFNEVLNMELEASDPDGHPLTVSVTGMDGVSAEIDGDILRISLDGTQMESDSGTAVVTVSDGFGGEDSVTLNITVIRNTPPYLTGAEGNVVVNSGSGDGTRVNLSEYFTDDDGDVLSYTVQNQGSGIVEVTFDGNTMVLEPVAQGLGTFTVTASDAFDETVSMTFNVLVRDGSRAADFYPNPVTTVLNVRTGEDVEGASITLSDAYGGVKLSRQGLDISPFKPAALDVSGLPGGLYRVTFVWTAGDGTSRTITTDIAKL